MHLRFDCLVLNPARRDAGMAFKFNFSSELDDVEETLDGEIKSDGSRRPKPGVGLTTCGKLN